MSGIAVEAHMAFHPSSLVLQWLPLAVIIDCLHLVLGDVARASFLADQLCLGTAIR